MSINALNYILAKKDWDKAYEDLSVLKDGGRNLFVGSRYASYYPSRYEVDGEYFVIKNTDDRSPDEYPIIAELEPNTEYVMSFSEGMNDRFRGIQNVRWEGNTRFYFSTGEGENGVVKFVGKFLPANQDYPRHIKIKLEKGNKATDWTPAPEDINAHPFVAELAETVYRSKQNEERIRNLENALTALGGGS